MKDWKISEWGVYKLDRALETVLEMVEQLKTHPEDVAQTVERLVDVREYLIEAKDEVRL